MDDVGYSTREVSSTIRGGLRSGGPRRSRRVSRRGSGAGRHDRLVGERRARRGCGCAPRDVRCGSDACIARGGPPAYFDCANGNLVGPSPRAVSFFVRVGRPGSGRGRDANDADNAPIDRGRTPPSRYFGVGHQRRIARAAPRFRAKAKVNRSCFGWPCVPPECASAQFESIGACMMDIVYLGLAGFLFASTVVLIRMCERL
jgi:hypothetical protein